MILGSKNQMVMQAEMGRWHGWDFPPPLLGRNAYFIEFRRFAPPANFLMTLRVLPEHAHPPKTAKNRKLAKNDCLCGLCVLCAGAFLFHI